VRGAPDGDADERRGDGGGDHVGGDEVRGQGGVGLNRGRIRATPGKEVSEMPIHDWTRVPAGIFHDFHQSWSIRIKDALNAGLLPEGYAALVEQRSGRVEGDVLAIEEPDELRGGEGSGVVATRPTAAIVRRSGREHYEERANRIVVRHRLGRVVAVVEIVWPGNKDSRAAVRAFVEKVQGFLSHDVHVLIIDLFPPGPRDPEGLHKLIWDDFVEEPFAFPAGKDRLLASYECGEERVAYLEPVGVGDGLVEMPLFLAPERHVSVPLGPTYEATYAASPRAMRRELEDAGAGGTP
jgi:hypothetical protein